MRKDRFSKVLIFFCALVFLCSAVFRGFSTTREKETNLCVGILLSEDGRQDAEGGGKKSEVRSQKSEVRIEYPITYNHQPVSSFQIPDTGKQDTIRLSSELKSKIEYKSDDSIRFDASVNKVFLFGNAEVKYEDITLKADYIEVDWETKTLFATYARDSAGNPKGVPVFTEGDESFKARSMRYNFDTRKGKIMEITAQEGEGYILGETVKKIDDDNYYIRKGTYTTCSNEHPHFSLSANRLKVIKNKRIVTGPAYLVVEDVPTPLAIPFGIFPNRKGRTSGIIFPAYGESTALGFFLRNGGYYFGISDHIDATLTGDIYSFGSWGGHLTSNYANRYHYNGNVSISYSRIRSGEPELPGYTLSKDFFIRWNHQQDPKAKPNSLFSASVNAGSSDYFTNNVTIGTDYITNTFQSSIAYSQTFPGKPYNLSLSARHNQNTQTKIINISLPDASFSVNRFNPLKRKKQVGETRWYEKISTSYSTNLRNEVQTYDSLLFESNTVERMRNGMLHSIPLSTSFKVFKHFTLSPSVSYTERWYLKTIRKEYDTSGLILIDTVDGFRAARDFTTSASLNTRIYGMAQFNGKFAALRHVMSPSLGFSYRPDFSNNTWNYYETITNPVTQTPATYSIYETGIFGSPPAGKYGFISFALDNNLEMKWRTENDTGMNLKKIKLLESLSIGTGYNLAADSLNLSRIGVNARTTLFEKLSLNFNSSFDPYITDSIGRNIDKFEINQNNRAARLTTATISSSFSIAGKNKSTTSVTSLPPGYNPDDYVDFNVPFNLAVGFNYSYSKPYDGAEKTFAQTVNFNGDISVTSKWKITFASGYDFKANDFSYTSLGFYRDLHCWEMRLNWVPLGFSQNYFFQINVKASVLQDLKLTKKNDRFDR